MPKRREPTLKAGEIPEAHWASQNYNRSLGDPT